MKHFFPILFLLVASVLSVAGQEEKTVVLPDSVMRELVGLILSESIEPSPEPRTVYFFDENINEKWLPDIKGVRFEIISSKEVERLRTTAHILRPVMKTEDGYALDFGSGTADHLSGGTWEFKLRGREIIELRTTNGWASVSCRGSASPD